MKDNIKCRGQVQKMMTIFNELTVRKKGRRDMTKFCPSPEQASKIVCGESTE